ncbi:MAG: SLBB domain-containing protein, partial [Terracidiphilus sp.]
ATGSMRYIQLRRGGVLVTELDLYDLLRNGDKSEDAQLLPGDVIFLPPVGPQVAMIGSINEPGIYELKGGTTLSAALKSAGGLTNLAGNERVLLERIENHRRWQVDDFPLSPSSMERVLKDGDIIEIFPILPRFDNAVTLRGNIAQPGRFPWHHGMRISDLIPSRDFLITRGYWSQQNRLGGNPHVDMMTDLSQSSAEINWDYASIERLDDLDLSTRLIAFHLGNALENPASSDNVLLRPGDTITVFSRNDLQLPEDKRAAFVRVSGEVNAPGVYRIAPGETLREVVERAGGLTPHSYLYASQLTRVSTRLAEEEQLRLAINQMQRDLLSRYAAAPALNAASATEQQSQLGLQQSVIAQLSSVHPTGRIVLDVKPRAGASADIPDFPLEDGDTFNIPARLSTIQVSGAVYNENAFRYQQGKRLAAYLRDAGGPTRQADIKRMFLIRADGTVVSRQSGGAFRRDNFESLSLLPGDAIYVPTKLKSPSSFAQQLPFITQMVSQTAMTGAVIGTTY